MIAATYQGKKNNNCGGGGTQQQEQQDRRGQRLANNKDNTAEAEFPGPTTKKPR